MTNEILNASIILSTILWIVSMINLLKRFGILNMILMWGLLITFNLLYVLKYVI